MTLLCKDKDFIINEEGKRAFVMMKQALILRSLNWDLSFKIMCDVSDYAVGAVLQQWLEKKLMDNYLITWTQGFQVNLDMI